MKKLFLLLLLCSTAWASKTTLTGTITDGQGNPLNGLLVMQLPVSAQDTTTNTAVMNTPVYFNLVNGSVSGGAQLYDVANLQPQGLYYQASAYDRAGNKVLAGNYYVTGTSFNLGAATPTSVTTSNVAYANLCLISPGTCPGAISPASINLRCMADQQAGANWGAKVTACATSLTNGGIIDATGFTPGSTQTLTANPLAGFNAAFTLITGPYTVQWDPTAITFDLPPNLHWTMYGTTLLNTNPSGVSLAQDPLAQIHTFIGSRIYKTTGSITSGTASLTVASATGVQPDTLVGIWGAGGANSNQNTTINQIGGIGLSDASFTVTSTTGWDLTRPSDQFVISIGSEYLLCTSGTATTFSGCTRGAFGTTAASHANGAQINFVPLFLAQVTAVSGTTLTLSANATTTVANATVWIGSDKITIDGQGVIDGAQPQTGTDNFLAGVVLLQGTNAYIGSGITVRRFEHAGIIMYAGWFNRIYAASELNGKPPLSKGTDVWLFGQAQNNFIAPASLSSGDNSFNINDRTTNADPWSGPTNSNTAYLSSSSGANYTNGATIQCICSNNTIYVGTVAVTGNAISINNNNGNWQPTNTTPPTGNVIKFGSVSTSGTNAISTSGYSGTTSNNRIEGGVVTAGAVSLVASGGDTVSWKDSLGWHQTQGGTTGILPTVTTQNGNMILESNVTQGSGTAKGGFFHACRGATDTAGDHCYGGWFKSTSQNQGSNEVGIHAEAADATGTIAEFAQGGTNKAVLGGAGILTTYAGLTTAGNGVPFELYNTAPAASHASVVATTMVTPTANTNYRFSYYLTQTVVGSSCAGNTTVQVALVYQDPNAAAGQTVNLGLHTVTTNGTLGVVPWTSGPTTWTFIGKASANVQFQTTFTAGGSCSPAPTVQLTPILEAF